MWTTEPGAAVAAVDAPLSARHAVIPAAIDRMAGLAARAVVMLAGEIADIRIGGRPGTEPEKDPLKQVHVPDVVPLHQRPGSWIASHAAEPEDGPGMGELPAELEVATEVVQPVTVELEMFLRDLECVDRSIRAWRPHVVCNETGVCLPDVESIAVVGNDDVGLVEELPQVPHKGLVVLWILLVSGIVRQGADLGPLLAQPLVGE